MRVALTEAVFYETNPASFAKGLEVFVYERGTEEEATVYSDEEAGAVVAQPLMTDAGGRAETPEASFGWVEEGSYDVSFAGQVIPWEAVRGGLQVSSSVAVIKEAPLNIEYPEYGAQGATVGAAVDCTAALEKAIAAVPANGGEILVPNRYKVSSQLNFDGRRSITLIGLGTPTGGLSPASQLIFTQEGAAAAISARSTSGFSIRNLQLEYLSSSFTGALVDLSHNGEGGDSSFGLFDNAHFVGSGVRSALGLDLDKAINQTFRSCYFQNLDVAAKGQREAGRYSNAIHFEGCAFGEIGTIPLRNAGEAWLLDGCTFEALSNGKAGAYDSGSGIDAIGLAFDSCWFGDSTNAEGTWITFRGKNLHVDGGSLGSGALGVYVPDATSDGLYLNTRFTSIIDAVRANWSGGASNQFHIANRYLSVSGKKLSLDNGATDLGAVHAIGGEVAHRGKLGFYGKTPASRPNVAAAGSVTAKELCEALETLGLVE